MKGALILLIEQQPEVKWPSKVCTGMYQDPQKLTIKHLKKALLGSYSYIKDNHSVVLETVRIFFSMLISIFISVLQAALSLNDNLPVDNDHPDADAQGISLLKTLTFV